MFFSVISNGTILGIKIAIALSIKMIPRSNGRLILWQNSFKAIEIEKELFMLLKSTTRHVRIFAAEVQDNELIPSEQVLTLDIDPDNELNWEEVSLQKVYRKFDDLVENYSGEDLTDYNLRRIGSDLEHFIRDLLLQGEISYNLDSRVLNYSMGLPRVESPESEGKYQI